MKLRNKITGEIKEIDDILLYRHNIEWHNYESIAELNEDWEDYTPQEPQEEIGRQLVSSPYDKDFYWADEEQQEAFREFCRKEDNRPENKSIPSDLYGDSARFGGVLSGNDRPRNMSEFNAWQNGADFLLLREDNERLGRERWLRFVREHGLEKFVEHKEPLIKDEKIRKAVRAWADVLGNKDIHVFHSEDMYNLFFRSEFSDLEIQFDGSFEEQIKDGTYTIEELCGEEDS